MESPRTSKPAVKSPVAAATIPAPTKAQVLAALPFGRQNYLLMLAGIAVILIGFFVMSLDKTEFGFGALGLTVGPLIVISGFIIEFFAILRK